MSAKTLRPSSPFRMGVGLALALLACAAPARAYIDGPRGTEFHLTARLDAITTGDGNSLLLWGYALDAGRAQYPGPTLVVNEGDVVTVQLDNELDTPVSIVFPGQPDVQASGGAPGLLTREATGGSPVTYRFVASHPGTYLYHSGTRPELQVEMGLFGALIVRPSSGADRAYNHAATRFDHEYLFVLSEMDPAMHDAIEFDLPGRNGNGGARGRRPGIRAHGEVNTMTGPEAQRAPGARPWDGSGGASAIPGGAGAGVAGTTAALVGGGVDNTTFHAVYWFLNGRNAPDTLADAFVPWLPTQPYNCLPRMHPGERVLLRIVSAGRDLHPFHHHGNHAKVYAKDGRLLESDPGVSGPDLAYDVFTVQAVPGETVDAIFEWSGKDLGWDVYGHTSALDPLAPSEWAGDHAKPLPVLLPELQDTTIGGQYSGSPFLGQFGPLPPGQGGFNDNAGFYHMWHSHTEKELVNNDIFPGGMMTMLIIEPPGVPIP